MNNSAVCVDRMQSYRTLKLRAMDFKLLNIKFLNVTDDKKYKLFAGESFTAEWLILYIPAILTN